MSIRITAKGLEISDPTFDELSRLKQLKQSIALAERDRIIELLEDGLFQYDDGVEVSAIGLKTKNLPICVDELLAFIKGENK